MKLTVLHPAYFPNIKMLSRIASADVVVWGETFIYKKHSTMNRARIKSVSGPQWLTVPVLTTGKSQQLIHDVLVDSEHAWRHTHLKSLHVCYQNSPYYFFLADDVQEILNREWINLNALLWQSVLFLCKKTRIMREFVKSSDLLAVKNRSRRVVEWLKQCGCDSYVIVPDELPFIDTDYIEKNGYSIYQQNFLQPRYHQLFKGFVSDLSGLDLLFNEGEMSKSIILKNTSISKAG